MNNLFPILAIETSGETCSAAIMISPDNIFEMNLDGKHIHSEKLFEIIDKVVESSGIELKNLQGIAVSIGPGSFTGLRIGLSAAKGIASGLNIPLIPIPTFEALAYKLAPLINNNEKFGIIKSAGLSDYYYSSYLKTSESLLKIEEIRLINNDEINILLRDIKILFGDQDRNPIIKKVCGPNASDIAYWSYLFGKDLLTFDYDYLEPYYFKEFITKVKK